MSARQKKFGIFLITLVFSVVLISCGSGGGGSGDGSSAGGSTSSTIEGTLSEASASSRVLGPGEGGIPNVTVSALGDSAVTDDNGNFTLQVDGSVFTGGGVEFLLVGAGINEAVVLSQVAGGPGVTGFVDFTREASGSLSAISYDASGSRLSSAGGGSLGCTQTGDFVDGGLGTLWKPVSESTGTVVVLMPPSYQNTDVAVYDANGQVVATPIRRGCCDHNGGREHVWFNRSASSLAGEATPLTVRFAFSNGVVDCRTVPNPTQRYD